MTSYVIVGSGVAGIAALEAIRAQDQWAELTLVSDDPFGYYSRPGLAYYLTQELDEKGLYPQTRPDWKALQARYVQQRAASLDAANHRLVLVDGSWLRYDRLLLATGSQAARLAIPGADQAAVFKLDNLSDARQIMEHARWGQTAVVVGGGITALEIVEGLAARKVRVHYLLRGDRYWPNVLDATESRVVEGELQQQGVRLHYRSELAAIHHKNGKVQAVVLKDGSTLRCDLLAAAIGVLPRVELAKSGGLRVERGVVVDATMQSSAPDVFAAGDVAQVVDPLTGKSSLDTLWGIARDQGHAAGLNMAGVTTAYRKRIAFNVTRLAGLTTTIIGSVGTGSEVEQVSIARGESESWQAALNTITLENAVGVNRVRIVIGEKTLLGAVVMGDQALSRPLVLLIDRQVDISSIRPALLNADGGMEPLVAFWNHWRAAHANAQL